MLAAAGLPAGLVAGVALFEISLAAADGKAAKAPPEWVQIAPRGSVTARDGRRFYFNPEALVAAFDADALKLPVDFQHESEFGGLGGATPARSWITALEAREAGLFARFDWLASGRSAVMAREYLYVSPTFWREPDSVTASKIKSVALVTSPALSLPALASAQTSSDRTEGPSPMLKELLAKLGLTENATSTEALSALDALRASAATPDPERFVPVAQYKATSEALSALQARVETDEAAAQDAKCSALVDAGVKAGKITPASKDDYMVFAKANFEACSAAIQKMPQLVSAGSDPVLDDADPKTGGAGTLSEAEKLTCAAMGLDEAAYLAARAA